MQLVWQAGSLSLCVPWVSKYQNTGEKKVENIKPAETLTVWLIKHVIYWQENMEAYKEVRDGEEDGNSQAKLHKLFTHRLQVKT